MGKTTLLDGASGTLLWEMAEKAGVAKDPVWKFNIEHPEFVAELADRYIEAGSEIIFSNTFSANRQSVERNSDYDVKEVIRKGVEIAKKQADGKNVRVFLDIGPLAMLLEPYGDLEADEAEEIFREIMDAGVGAGADGIMIETFMDIEMMKIAAEAACSYGIPVFCSMSFEKVGKTMFGNSVQTIVEELSQYPISAIGMNCSVGPVAAQDIIRQFAESTDLPIIAKPNAGLPVVDDDGNMISEYTAQQFCEEIKPVLEHVSYVGSCCGSSPEYISELKKII